MNAIKPADIQEPVHNWQSEGDDKLENNET